MKPIVALTLLVVSCVVSADEVVTTGTHRLTKIIDGVYLAQSTAPLFNSNSLVLVNDSDVIVVDSHITPQKGRELIASIRELTDKPITTLILSHFHYDHAHGNQAFSHDVEIIGHEYTRAKMSARPLEEGTFKRGKAGNHGYLARLKEQLPDVKDDEEKKSLEHRIGIVAAHIEAWEEIDPIPPGVTLHKRMTLYRGDREIQILFLGRAHTGGDVAVYLPAEKLIFTGDMMLGGPSWLGNGFVDEWAETLENLKQLDFEVIVPGHGNAFRDRNRIDLVQAFYRDLWQKTAVEFNKGTSAEDAAKVIDMTNHKALGIKKPGFDPLAVARMYERMQGED